MFFYCLLLFAYASSVDGAGNSTDATVGWVSDPDGRGTFSLILSCLVTLGLCVWSAMHLNIPAVDETDTDLYLNGLRWGWWGVVAPELVIYAAWKQYYSAKLLQQEITKLYAIDQEGSNRNEKKTLPDDVWTMVHGFYAGMGGFVIDFDDDNTTTKELSPGHTPRRLTVTPRGILFLAKCGHLPRITKVEIKDKSKADGIAKALVLIQAGWLIVQIIGRVAQKLPVTLLEVNTLGHVVCAFIIYVMWWYKPRLVQEPTRLQGDWVKPLASYMLMSSQMSGWRTIKSGLLQQPSRISELSVLAYFPSQNHETVTGKEQSPEMSSEITLDTSRSTSNTGIYTPAASTIGHFGPRPTDGIKKNVFEFAEIIEQARTPSTLQESHWSLAATAYEKYPAVRDRFNQVRITKGDSNSADWCEPMVEELVVRAAGNWPDKALLNQQENLFMSTVVWFASILYGAVHIAAWNDHFPTRLEAWLWRSSAVFIAWSGAVWVIANTLTDRSRAVYDAWVRILSLQSHWYSYGLLGTAVVVCGTSYIFARAYLVIEAFISMRSLPAAAYDTPDWDRYIPHF